MYLANNILNLRKIKEIIIQIIIPFFYFFIFLKYYLGEGGAFSSVLIPIFYISLGVFTTFYMILKLKSNSLIFFLIFFLLFIPLIQSIVSSNFRIEDNILVFCYFGMALLPMFYKLNYQLFKIIDYIIISFFVLAILKGVDPNEIFSVSRNFISVLLIIGLGYHIISSYQNNITPSFILFVLSLGIAIWAAGRGGIIVFSVLLIGFAFLSKIEFYYKILFVLFIGILIFLIYRYYYNNIFFELGMERFNKMGLDGDRVSINSEYLSKTKNSIFNFLFGTPLRDVKTIVEVYLNPHNSFIRLHVYYGFFGFIIVLFSVLYSIINYIKCKENILLLLLASLLIRSFLDSISFHGPLDPLIYYLIFNTMSNIYLKR